MILASIAQLDRVSGFEPGGCEFKSCWAHQLARWRNGLTHSPLKATFTGSNPVRVTIVNY